MQPGAFSYFLWLADQAGLVPGVCGAAFVAAWALAIEWASSERPSLRWVWLQLVTLAGPLALVGLGTLATEPQVPGVRQPVNDTALLGLLLVLVLQAGLGSWLVRRQRGYRWSAAVWQFLLLCYSLLAAFVAMMSISHSWL